MDDGVFLPDPSGLTVASWDVSKAGLMLTVCTTQPQAPCPYCTVLAHRVHSHYQRTPADLPCCGYQVRLVLQHRTFVERLPTLVQPYARRTDRLAQQQQVVAFWLGGEAGAQLLLLLAMPTSADTLLRLIRRAPEAAVETPRVLGVDDWALRRGQVYGTILVDLEKGEPIDLLPERSADVLAHWLKAHPGVEIISRDRGLEYIKGATDGAPDALQVADRWHLLKNWREAVERYLERNLTCLRAVTPPAERATTTAEHSAAAKEALPRPLTKVQQAQQVRHARRQARYDVVLALFAEGHSQRSIARQLGMGKRTVAKYLAVEVCPLYPQGVRRRSKLDPYWSYLYQRWQAGCRNASQLWREIRQQGFCGSRGLVGRWAAGERPRRRHARPRGSAVAQTYPAAPGQRRRALTARQAAWWFVTAEGELEPEDQQMLQRVLAADRQAARVYTLSQAFAEMFRQRTLGALMGWLEAASQSGIGVVRSFAECLRQDLEAVKAALALPWSTGPVEGQINRLKLIKRAMYGRAGFDLLRRRVLWQPRLALV
ncbi:MAG: ISL3 family transposase [Chloroflexi bacterium]|nr:MAG: ISL3 family transposase [Chloroflexota bacterium]